MSTLLIQLTCGPEEPTKAALAFLVGKIAVEAGHEVTLFLVGEGVQLIRKACRDSVVGVGTGPVGEHYEGFVAGGGKICLSTLSSRARGVTDADLAGTPARFVFPQDLLQLILDSDKVVTY